MSSRLGSLVVVVLLAGLVAVAGLVIAILVDDGDAEGNGLIAPSVREGDLFLIGEPREIQVVAASESPVSGITLYADDELVTQSVPVADTSQGTYRTTLTWTPDTLGFVMLSFRALDIDGDETRTDVRVEVTDDEARIAATLRVSFLSLSPLQRVQEGVPLRILVQAAGEGTVTTFELLVNSSPMDQAEPRRGEDGRFIGVFTWTPSSAGLVDVTVRATTADGGVASADVQLQVVGEGEQASTTAGDAADADDDQALDNVPATANGRAFFISPDDGDEFELTEGLEIEIVIAAEETGSLASLELYVNTQLFAGFTPDQASGGRETVTFEPTAAGAYALEVVAFNTAGQRFDSRIAISVVEAGEGDDGQEDEAEDGGEQATNRPDLVPIGASLNSSNGVVVNVENRGGAPVSASVMISVLRADTGVLLGESPTDLTLAPGARRSVTLNVTIAQARTVEIVVDTLGAVQEADENNNTLQVSLQPSGGPDLTVIRLQLTDDGIPVADVTNRGSAPANGPIVVTIVFNGETVDRLEFGGDITAGAALTLSGIVPIQGTGQLSAVIDPDNTVAEANEGNNALTITVN